MSKAMPFVDMTLAQANSKPKDFRAGYADAPAPGRRRRGSIGGSSPGAVDHALSRSSKRITAISNTTRSGVRKRIAEAIEQGMSPREAGQYVREWSGFTEYRAERIARTEMMNAYNTAAIASYRDLGVQQVVADDGDEDAECAERHGQVFTVDEADGIEDHPNGTLDWLPVAPDITAGQVQGELNVVRGVTDFSSKVEAGASKLNIVAKVAEQVSYVAPQMLPERLLMDDVKTSKWVRASREDVVKGIRQGEVKLEKIAEERWGWKGGANASEHPGVRVVREPGSRFTTEHEARFADAFEDAADKVGGYDRFEVDQVIFSDKRGINHLGGNSAADYARANWHSDGMGGRQTTSRIKMYNGSESYLRNYNYREYAVQHGSQADDYFSAVQHELGHALEFAQKDLAGALESMDVLHGTTDSAKVLSRISKELTNCRSFRRDTIKRMENYQSMVDEATEVTEGNRRTLSTMREIIAAYDKQEQGLLKVRDETKALAKMPKGQQDNIMTSYGKKDPREDFAESFWFYSNKPDELRRLAPNRYAYIDNIVKHGGHAH